MKNRTFLFFLFFISLTLIFSKGIIAPAVSTTINTNTGLEIKYPSYENIVQNHYFDFNFHVFNISDGLPVSNTTVSCNFHLYNQSGDHIWTFSNLSHDAASEHGIVNEWVARVNGNNFTTQGVYSYIIQCNSSSHGGFLSTNFIVSPEGVDGSLNFFIIISFFLICLAVFAIAIRNIPMTIIGSFALMSWGVYTAVNGFGLIKNTQTEIFSVVMIAFGMYWSVKSALEYLDVI